MGATKRYCTDQFRVNKLTLKHDDAADFYLGSWQAGLSPVPLLCLRLLIFVGCLGILISSMAVMGGSISLRFWPIYMTHWGVFMITVASGLALLVSVMATVNGPFDSDPLPWYVKLYWAVFTITVPLAFFITVFYYALLASSEEEFAVDPVLDVFIHCINSVMMVCLLAAARHPVHLLQFLYPLVFSLIYMVFSLIYYFSGGKNPFGEHWIYPMLDWSAPGTTTIVILACAVFLLILHILVVALSALRQWLTRKYVLRPNTVNIIN